MPEQTYSLREAARRIGVTHSTLHAAIRRDKLKGIEVGGRIVGVSESELAQYQPSVVRQESKRRKS